MIHKLKSPKVIGSAAIIFALAWGLTLMFPQFLFAHKIRHGNFVIYSTDPIDNNIYSILDSVSGNLQVSSFYYKDLKQRIFLCNNPALYTLLCYPARKTFAGNNELLGHIFVANADIKRNKASRKMDNRMRTFVNLITHETTHSLTERELGYFKYNNLTTWQKEGYCDYIANGGTLSFSEGIMNLCSDKSQDSYFTPWLATKYLIDEKGVPHQDAVLKDFDYDNIKKILKERHCVAP